MLSPHFAYTAKLTKEASSGVTVMTQAVFNGVTNTREGDALTLASTGGITWYAARFTGA